jgi:LysR family glycine cleavage system transcriptional activator
LVTEQLKQYTREGMLRVATCPAFGQKWLIPRLSRFKSDFPQIDLRISNVDRLPELSNTEIDIAVFYSHCQSVEQHEALIDLLLPDEIFPVCSPSFQVEYRLDNEEDLKLAQVIQDNQLMNERKIGWSDWFRGNVNTMSPISTLSPNSRWSSPFGNGSLLRSVLIVRSWPRDLLPQKRSTVMCSRGKYGLQFNRAHV